ncbi:MAG: hypothetical protein F2673_06220 [Actinobacteria bacterium]|uniref:Unannotated protein n=1 Tax=freshwater metagenome TaxID=449393 RepID=A0A6J6QZ45_9ZZZZ|nr:hypothetical protein [Actinomycetota bacterium]
MEVNLRADVDRFYSLVGEMRARCGGERTLSTCDAGSGWPERGVYFFFEPGELRSDGGSARVVHVGTHALRPSSATLWNRLSNHRGHISGEFAGGGSHRGSIFREHVGAAMLSAQPWPDEIRQTWGVGSSASRSGRVAEHALEREVTNYIGAMPLLWVPVNDEPSPTSDRAVIKQGAVALLSRHEGGVGDRPSNKWLGWKSDRPEIVRSGLWNVEHVGEDYHPSFLDVLERWVS